jgi:hypothetical protein
VAVPRDDPDIERATLTAKALSKNYLSVLSPCGACGLMVYARISLAAGRRAAIIDSTMGNQKSGKRPASLVAMARVNMQTTMQRTS